MFDNLRENSFYEDELNTPAKEQTPKAAAAFKRSNTRLLGMNAMQRLIISLMLFFTVCVIGTLAMFILGRMSVF